MRTTTTIMVAKAIAAIALTASTAGGVALATHSSPTTPRDQLNSTTTNAGAAASDALAADLTPLTTAPSTALADDHARPDTPVGPARDDEENDKGTNDRASSSAAHPTGRCQALSNISDDQPGKATASPAFAELSCPDNDTATTKPTVRPTAPPGNPDQRTGKPDSDQDKNTRGDTDADKQADNRQR